MFEAGREAARGGAAMLEWTKYNQEAAHVYNTVVEHARVHWRRSADDVKQMFTAVSRSGIGMVEGVGASTDRVLRAITEVAQATRTAFALQFLGFDPDQITSIYRSLAVNLRMTVGQIEEAMYRFLLISQDTTLAWRDQIRIVVEALSQYSKFGVTLDDVTLMLSGLVRESQSLREGFMTVGMAYDILMNKLGIRTRVTPQQVMMAFSQLTPTDVEQILTGLRPEQLRTLTGPQREERQRVLDALTKWMQRLPAGTLPPGLERAEQLLEEGVPIGVWPQVVPGLDPRQWARIGPALARRLGAGRFIQGMPLEQAPIFWQQLQGMFGSLAEGFWEMRVGRAADPLGLTERALEGIEASSTAAQEAKKVLDKLRSEGREVSLTAKDFYANVDQSMRKVADNTTGLLRDVGFIASTMMRAIVSREAREQWRTREEMEMAESRRSQYRKWLEEGGRRRIGRELRLDVPEEFLEPEQARERRRLMEQMSEAYRAYFEEAPTPETLMQFLRPGGPVDPGARRTLLEMLSVMRQMPELEQYITPEAFPGLNEVLETLLETGIMGAGGLGGQRRRLERYLENLQVEAMPPTRQAAAQWLRTIGPHIPQETIDETLWQRWGIRPGEIPSLIAPPSKVVPLPEIPAAEAEPTTALPKDIRDQLGLGEGGELTTGLSEANITVVVNIDGEELNIPVQRRLNIDRANERPTDVDTAGLPT